MATWNKRSTLLVVSWLVVSLCLAWFLAGASSNGSDETVPPAPNGKTSASGCFYLVTIRPSNHTVVAQFGEIPDASKSSVLNETVHDAATNQARAEYSFAESSAHQDVEFVWHLAALENATHPSTVHTYLGYGDGAVRFDVHYGCPTPNPVGPPVSE